METFTQNNPGAGMNPASRTAQAAGKPGQRQAPASRTVLVVDDNKDYRELVKHLLTVNHYKVLEAGNGEEALAVLSKSMPDLILVDFNMPKMNGYELIQEVRSNYETHSLRIIMFTGATNRQHLRTLNMDISDFLEKPVSNAKLLESIARIFEVKRPPVPESRPAPRPEPRPAPASGAPEPVSLEIERFEMAAPEPHAAYEPEPAPQMPQRAPAPVQAVPVELPPEAQLPPETEPLPEPAPEPAPAPEAAPEAEIEVMPEPAPEPESEVPEIDMLSGAGDQDLEMLESGAPRKEEPQSALGLENLASDSPLIQRVNKILMAAVEMRASDIHIEPFEDRVLVRARVDGVLKQLTTLPISIHPRLTARIKIMSSLVITERRLPQDGQFRVMIKGNKIEFRVSTLPCIKGEKIVMRILGQSKLNSSLSQLALTPRELKAVQGSLKGSNGLVLVTGPTGSGKTTTLYTMINVLNRPDVNIMTAEDPVEYEVPNVNQVKILSSIGLTFESTLRAFLRQDPDIMLVGEIRDVETAEIAIKASITGHLVFSTLHTNSAPATIVRLTHMGVAPYLVAASVKMVIAQRLVRTLCTQCRAPGALTAEDKKFLNPKEIELLKTVYHPVGCHSCSGGYSGRRAVFEVMPVETSAMRQLITTSNNVDLLTELAVKEGMTSLRQSALEAVRQGQTSLSEAFKIMMG
ncbi:MAG: ATPase, T2SS/T4P/T4SS family [Elusimicrobiales bacterium]|nr:ATPase, T2SS/T4P/T4SS family [Elusimicrobiales bacterium]